MLAHTEWLYWSPGTFAAVTIGALVAVAVAMWLDTYAKRNRRK